MLYGIPVTEEILVRSCKGVQWNQIKFNLLKNKTNSKKSHYIECICFCFYPQIVLSVFAYAAASPGAPVDVHRLTPALPTISAGDINGAVIEAHVEASDHFRAAVDATRQVSDKVRFNVFENSLDYVDDSQF